MLIACTETGHHSGGRLADGLFKTSRDVGRNKQSIQNIARKMWEEECLRNLTAGERGVNEEDVEGVTKNKKEMMFITVFTVCTALLPPLDCLKFLWLIHVEILSCIFMKGLTTGHVGHNSSCAGTLARHNLSLTRTCRQSLGRSNC